MKAVIIEDEINAYEYLRDLIGAIRPEIIIVEHLDSVEDAVNWFHQEPEVDMVFMDIQLSDGLSFEILKHVEIVAPIIFTTAYDEYAIRAFKLNSIDYLLKPISKEDLSRSMVKYDSLTSNKNRDGLDVKTISELLNGMGQSKKNRFLIKKGGHFEFISASDISFIHSEDSLTFIHTPDGRRHMYSKTVAALDSELDRKAFFQINRKQIVNIKAVKKIHPYLNQRLKLDLGNNDGGLDFIVSRNRSTEFKTWVDN